MDGEATGFGGSLNRGVAAKDARRGRRPLPGMKKDRGLRVVCGKQAMGTFGNHDQEGR